MFIRIQIIEFDKLYLSIALSNPALPELTDSAKVSKPKNSNGKWSRVIKDVKRACKSLQQLLPWQPQRPQEPQQIRGNAFLFAYPFCFKRKKVGAIGGIERQQNFLTVSIQNVNRWQRRRRRWIERVAFFWLRRINGWLCNDRLALMSPESMLPCDF